MRRRLLAVGEAVGGPCQAGTKRLEGHWGRTEAVGGAECPASARSGALPAPPPSLPPSEGMGRGATRDVITGAASPGSVGEAPTERDLGCRWGPRSSGRRRGSAEGHTEWGGSWRGHRPAPCWTPPGASHADVQSSQVGGGGSSTVIIAPGGQRIDPPPD